MMPQMGAVRDEGEVKDPTSGAGAPLDDGRVAQLRERLARWHAGDGRSLRFRGTLDPWAILVSEVMAQQTQVARVEPAWEAFMAAYPTPAALAAASPAEVLRRWAGLGYNRRALHLQRAAALMVERHGGRVPRDVSDLLALPGVGPYTARAVAALAFGQPVAPVDTNVRRVVSRLVGTGAARRLSPVDLQDLADRLVERGDPGAWTNAMMDLGATICLPRAPRCEACPLRLACDGAGRQEPRASVTSGGRHAQRVAFEHTSRWLRGRIVERLRRSEEGAWTRVQAPIGAHGHESVERALVALERDGLLERRADGEVRLPSAR